MARVQGAKRMKGVSRSMLPLRRLASSCIRMAQPVRVGLEGSEGLSWRRLGAVAGASRLGDTAAFHGSALSYFRVRVKIV